MVKSGFIGLWVSEADAINPDAIDFLHYMLYDIDFHVVYYVFSTVT